MNLDPAESVLEVWEAIRGVSMEVLKEEVILLSDESCESLAREIATRCIEAFEDVVEFW